MKRMLFFLCIFLLSIMIQDRTALAQDVETSIPTKSKEMGAIPLQLGEFKGFTLIVNRNCQIDQPIISILTTSGSVPTEITTIDTVLVVKILATGFLPQTPAMADKFKLQFPFVLHIVFESDTAKFRIDINSKNLIAVERLNTASFIKVEEIRNLPENCVWMQFLGQDFQKFKEILAKLSQYAEFKILDEGYYQCLPWKIYKEKRSDIKFNKTDFGFFTVIIPKDGRKLENEAMSLIKELNVNSEKVVMFGFLE
jgi:hypothetical protein